MIEEKLGPDGSYVQKDEPEERKGDAPFKRRRLFDDEPNAARAGIPKREPDPEPEEELAPIDEPEEEGKREAGPWPEAPLPPKGATALERLTYPRGLLGHAVQYIYDTMNLPDRTMALAGALSACGKGIDRKVIGPTGNGTVLFNLVIGDSTSGKQRVISCIRLMLRAMGEEHCLPAGGIASVQSIEEMLEGTAKQPAKPSVLVVIDEYGSFLTRISSKHQTGNVSQIPATLQTLWGWPPEDVWVGSMKVGKEMDKAKVYGPAFSILALTTDRSFYGALKSKDISNGLVNRHNIFNVGRGAEEWVDAKYHYTKFPKWLGEALKKVAGQPAPLNNTPTPLRWPNGTIRAMLWDFRRIDWNAETKDRWFKFINRIRKMPSDQREVWGRAADIALRMATIVAVFRGSKIIEIEDMDWAIALVEHSTEQLEQGLNANMLEDYQAAEACDYLRAQFIRRFAKPDKDQDPGVMTLGVIRKALERKLDDLRKIPYVIHQLQTCGDIEELGPSMTAGKPTQKYKWIGKR